MPDPRDSRLQHRRLRHSRAGVLWYALLFATLARADSAPLPAEFWDYFMEYSDQQGDLFDPMDLANTQQTEQTTADPNDNEEQAP